MSNFFGYQIHNDRQINFDNNDLYIIKYVDSLEPTLKTCISCGTCTATCTATQFTNFNLRKLITMLRRGENNIKEEINKCMLCGKCSLVCPRGVNTRNVILAIKKTINYFNL
ncbi:MAG TPA: 4Fe-4S dicluster domain-containing protein [Bacteroidales bacterium]|nr:4Fe-4S dicluster domain-containing protein [Bacteroidales bacterium]